ncbi:MAG: hypothetical protein KF816_01135 [Melioribacteraceae bacterium]|nr:hypothetical protein [Melioribacteraceae bacterium]
MSLNRKVAFLDDVECLQINLHEELQLLRVAFYEKINKYEIALDQNKDSTFNLNNWLLTFPYNYCYISPSEINRIRKLALINVMYLYFIMAEDNIVDEYHLPQNCYREMIFKFIDTHFLKNEAITQLVEFTGPQILNYINHYEGEYYKSLKWEKKEKEIGIESIFENDNLHYLGIKLLPLNITFVCFCYLTNKQPLIHKSEIMLTKYHIAKQLCDDLIDIKKDFVKPDKSYLLCACLNAINTKNAAIEDVYALISQDNFKNNLYSTIESHLNKSINISEELNFEIFTSHIKGMLAKIKESNFFN